MTSFFPDVNVWMALSVVGHIHNDTAAAWLAGVRLSDRVMFSRYTQLGLLRLLANEKVMGGNVLNLAEAWGVVDRWYEDPRCEFAPEPAAIEDAFRQACSPVSGQTATNTIGDSYLLGFALSARAVLVTFDRRLFSRAGHMACRAVLPSIHA